MIREAHHKFSKWRIAVVVDVHFVEEEEGSVRRLKLDFSSQYCPCIVHLIELILSHRGTLLP
jgi:hypothetical protein